MCNPNHKEVFLYQSIVDMQATIRAIDVKIGFLFVIIFLPLSVLDKLLLAGLSLFKGNYLYLYPMLILIVVWMLSVYVLFRGVVAISNPSEHIKGGIPNGMFFNGSLYSLNFIDNLFNFPIKSSKTIDECCESLPIDTEMLLKELMYESMKLSYIRTIKIKRYSFCVKLTLFWIMLGVILGLLQILKVGI